MATQNPGDQSVVLHHTWIGAIVFLYLRCFYLYIFIYKAGKQNCTVSRDRLASF